MTKVILGTNTDQLPTIEVGQTNGRYSWRWRHGPDGPELIDKPVRLVRGQPDPDGKTVEPPAWAVAIVSHWYDGVHKLHNSRVLNPNDLAEKARDIEAHYKTITKAIVYEPPGVRQQAARWAADLNRRAVEHGTPLQEAEMYLNAAARVTNLLRRTEPKKSTGNEGPTAETVAKHQPDPIETLMVGNFLSERQKEAAEEARRIWRAITHRMDAKAGNPEGGGGGGFSNVVPGLPPPLDEQYTTRYRPWGLMMSRRQWWFDPSRRGMFELGECRHAAAVTYWHVLSAVLFDGLPLAVTDSRYRLPPGRTQLIIKVGLDDYGRAI